MSHLAQLIRLLSEKVIELRTLVGVQNRIPAYLLRLLRESQHARNRGSKDRY